ncbi:IclR family transcriptional regulator [Halobellus salinisoli]|uniref:IclR family transcriptional regulator n=1 Tax=Halobellus salinisoli TaxID=3108500 RepID=UPI003009B570
MSEPRVPLKTVKRAFDIIELLKSMDSAGPTEISERMDLPKSTVYESLCTLESRGYLIKEDGKYKISYKFLTIGGHRLLRNLPFQVAKPELSRLAKETGELVNFHIEERGQSIIIHQVAGENSLGIVVHPGMEGPLHTQAAGKVLLTHLPRDYSQKTLNSELEKRTEKTITDKEQLQGELEQIREQGYAIDWDEQLIGMGVASVPVFTQDDLIGALAIVCETNKLKDQEFQKEIVSKLQEASNTISLNVQYGTDRALSR